MIHEGEVKVLERILAATREGAIAWREEADGWYSSDSVLAWMMFRFRYYEATNQVGADPLAVEFSMPALNGVYFAGTAGYGLFREILAAAFEKWHLPFEPGRALALLEEGLAKGAKGAKGE